MTWWLLPAALLLGVIAMHSMVSAPVGHAAHATAGHPASGQHVESASTATAVLDAPATEGGSADLGCGAMLLMCLAVLVLAALSLLAAPARRWLERSPTPHRRTAARARPPFVGPVLLTTSILRC